MPRSGITLVPRRALVGVCVLFLAVPGTARNLKHQKKGSPVGAIRPVPGKKLQQTPGSGHRGVAPKQKGDCPGKPDKPDHRPVPPYTGPSMVRPAPGDSRPGKPLPYRPPEPGRGGGRPIPLPQPLPLPYPQPDYYHPWDFFHLLELEKGSAIPPEPCYRGLGPCTVTARGTGMMKWGSWDFEVLPCDYGEKFIDPADKTCRSVNDCIMLPVPWDCCGSLFLAGVNKKKARRYLRLNHKCKTVLEWCSCPPGKYRAGDFRSTGDPADIRLGCIQGMCRTSLP